MVDNSKVSTIIQENGIKLYRIQFTDNSGKSLINTYSEEQINEFLKNDIYIEGLSTSEYMTGSNIPKNKLKPIAISKSSEDMSDWEKESEKLILWLESQGSSASEIKNKINYYRHGNKSHDVFEIQGSTYNLTICIAFDDYFNCKTIHKQRLKETDDYKIATANMVNPKTLNRVKSYIKKWITQ